MLTVGSFCLAFTMVGLKSYYIALGCICFAAISAVVFYHIEKKHLHPIIPLYIMKNPITAICGANIINNLFASGNQYILPQYAAINGISSSKISLVLVLSCCLNLGGSIVVPILQKKILTRILLTSSYIIMILCTVIIILGLNNVLCFIIFFILINTACSIVSTILYPLTMMSVPAQFGS